MATLAGFQPASVTFVSPNAGFVLGTQACATGTCTTLGATTDAGRTWAKAGVLPPALTGDAQGVRKVRFATASDGWAFGPQLWSTHDGGRSWRQIPQPGPVSDVEASGGVAYAIVASCSAEPCGSGVRLLRTPVDADTWTAVAGVALQNDGVLALHGRAVWVVAGGGPGAAKFLTSADGTSWHFVANPCATLGPNWSLGGVAPVTTTSVYLLCISDPGAGSEAKKVLFSTDGGAHGTPTSADPPTGGLADGIAAASTAVVVVPARSGASWVYRSADGGHAWAAPLTQGDGGMGYNDVGFTTATQGVAIHGSPSAQDPSALFMTRDAGATWTPVAF
ncbi:MAG: hypothetical protein QOC73_2411 [Actinomycetota bacterium]|nr:hypothetical protein [Actinomycetota bacterium]